MTDRILNYFKKFLPWVIVGIVITLFFLRPSPSPQVVTEYIKGESTIDTIYKYDTIRGDTVFLEPPIRTIIDTLWKTRYIDTSFVLQDYFNTNIGQSTIYNTDDLFISITWFTNMNKLTKAVPLVINREKTLINTVTKQVEPSRFLVGVSVLMSERDFDVVPQIAYRHKKIYFTYGYGFRKTHLIGITYGL